MYLQKCTPEQLKDIYAEFGVTENTLKQDAATIMDWLEKQPHLPNVKDEEFIINVLLKCKASVEGTKRMLGIYFTSNYELEKLFPERDIDTKLNILHNTLLNRGFYTPMPKLTPEGYRVLILAFRDMGPVPSSEDMVQMMDITLKMLLKFDKNKSVIVIYDFKGLTVNAMTTIAAAIPKLSDIVYKKMRMRYVKFYLVNLLPQYEFLINFCKALMKAKEVKKIEVWKKEKEDLIEVIPKDVLPVEFGGTEKPLLECAKLWYQEIVSLKPWLLLELTWMADPEKRPAENQNNDHTSANYGLDGTFKKLAVD